MKISEEELRAINDVRNYIYDQFIVKYFDIEITNKDQTILFNMTIVEQYLDEDDNLQESESNFTFSVNKNKDTIWSEQHMTSIFTKFEIIGIYRIIRPLLNGFEVKFYDKNNAENVISTFKNRIIPVDEYEKILDANK